MSTIYFPFADYWWFYLSFIVFVFFVLILDLGVFHRQSHEVKFKEAAIWSCVWVCLALVFNFLFYKYSLYKFETFPELLKPGLTATKEAKRLALEFLSGYLIEKSLSVDNIFIFIFIFSYFAIPPKFQHRILFFGIIGALAFRAIFISLGSVLMQYQAVVIFFGILLIFTGVKLFIPQDDQVDLEKNIGIRLVKKFIPITTTIENEHFTVRKNNVLYGTPLLLCLVTIEFSDIIFAIDSVPAIFAISREPLIVFTSNIFAILGLRAMYFLLAGIMDKFHFLKYALGIILIFVGLKMAWLNQAFDGHFPIVWSLAFIAATLLLAIVASLLITNKERPKKS